MTGLGRKNAALAFTGVIWLVLSGTQLAAGDVAGCLGRADRSCFVEQVRELALSLPEAESRVRALASLAKRQLAATDREGALETLARARDLVEQVRDPEQRDNARVSAIDVMARLGDFDGALAEADRIADAESRALTVGLIASIAEDAGDLDVAAGLIAHTTELWRETIRESLARAYAEAGDWEKAIEYLGGLDPLWRGFSNLGQWIPQRLAFLGRTSEAMALAAKFGDARARDFARAGIVAGLVARDDVDGARDIAATVADPSARDDALASIAAGLVARRRLDAAEAAVAEIEDPGAEGEALAKVLAARTRAGETARALATAAAAPMKNQERLFGAIARPLAEAGDVGGALNAAAEIADRQNREDILIDLAEIRLAADDREGALRVLETFTGRTAFLGPIYLTVLRRAIAAFARAGLTERAIAVAHSLPDPADRAHALFDAAEAAAPDAASADRLLEAGAWALQHVTDTNAREYATGRLAVLWVRMGKGAEAAPLLDSISATARFTALLDIAFEGAP
jgi:hypothetical protein